jgi:hypothetical protein
MRGMARPDCGRFPPCNSMSFDGTWSCLCRDSVLTHLAFTRRVRVRTKAVRCVGDGKARACLHRHPRCVVVFQKQACPLVASRRSEAVTGGTLRCGVYSKIIRGRRRRFRSLTVLSLQPERVVLRRRDARVPVRSRDGPSDLSPGTPNWECAVRGATHEKAGATFVNPCRIHGRSARWNFDATNGSSGFLNSGGYRAAPCSRHCGSSSCC